MKASLIVRNVLTTLMIFVTGVNTFAQEDKHPCEKEQSIYGLRMNEAIGNDDTSSYIAAYPFWQRFVKVCPADDEDCPCYDVKHWYNGVKIINVLIADASTNEDRKKVLRDSLYMIHETILKNFGKTHDAYMRYGLDLMRDRTKIREAFDIFEKSLNDSIIKFDDITYQSIQGSFSVAYTMVRATWEDCNWLVEHYFKISAILEKRMESVEDKTNWELTQKTIDKYAELCMSCEQLETIISENIKKLPESCEDKIEKINRYLGLLDRKGCQDSENFKTLAVMAYDCGKTHEAAHKLALMYFNDKNYSKAYEYVKEAIDLDKEGKNTAKYQHDAAKIAQKMGSCSTAISHARSAIANGDASANKVIGDCIAASSSTCGNTTLQKKSVYWLASDYYQKAGMGADYFKNNYPTKAEIFDEDLQEGSSFTVPCYGESTVVRVK